MPETGGPCTSCVLKEMVLLGHSVHYGSISRSLSSRPLGFLYVMPHGLNHIHTNIDGHIQKASGRARPRLLFCATGACSQLPIHAARASTPEGFQGLTDYVVPSYTPTLGAVLNAHRDYQPIRKSDAKVLLASVPNPYKWVPLPFAEQEVAEVEAVLPATSVLRLSDQEGQGATVAGIQEKLPEASILHLACHGHQDPKHPLDSGFVMRDGMLTVSDIMALRLPNVLLAFLSACETAKGDEKQPDQAVHLAAAMLFAGIKSVVGTMW
jgi:CHAT domain-containing protein